VSSATRQSNAAARERLEALTDSSASVDLSALAADLQSVTGVLDREIGLRRTLTDPATSGQRKADLVATLFGGKIGADAVDLVSGLVRSRWSAARDLVDAVEQLASVTVIIGADKAGALDEVEDELFRFGRVVAGSNELRAALHQRRGRQRAQGGAGAAPARRQGQPGHGLAGRRAGRAAAWT
jgi:F-type H+-transporting ATPase subunit delta